MLWNSEQWKEEFERLSVQRNAKQKEEVRFLLLNMLADVFKHTVFLVQQGYYYNEEEKKINFPDARTMIAGTKFYDTPQTVHHIPTIINETIVKVENIDCLLATENLLKERRLSEVDKALDILRWPSSESEFEIIYSFYCQ